MYLTTLKCPALISSNLRFRRSQSYDLGANIVHFSEPTAKVVGKKNFWKKNVLLLYLFEAFRHHDVVVNEIDFST
jgi:hypothetical protein